MGRSSAGTAAPSEFLPDRATDRLRWRAAAAVQEKFDRTEPRFGGELAYRPALPVELQWSAYVAPGAELQAQANTQASWKSSSTAI